MNEEMCHAAMLDIYISGIEDVDCIHRSNITATDIEREMSNPNNPAYLKLQAAFERIVEPVVNRLYELAKEYERHPPVNT